MTVAISPAEKSAACIELYRASCENRMYVSLLAPQWPAKAADVTAEAVICHNGHLLRASRRVKMNRCGFIGFDRWLDETPQSVQAELTEGLAVSWILVAGDGNFLIDTEMGGFVLESRPSLRITDKGYKLARATPGQQLIPNGDISVRTIEMLHRFSGVTDEFRKEIVVTEDKSLSFSHYTGGESPRDLQWLYCGAPKSFIQHGGLQVRAKW